MSLYNHVANKDDVIDGMLDLVLDEGELPATGGDWETSIRDSAISVHAALRKHPWAANVLMAYPRVRPARLQYMDSLLGRLTEAGFSADTIYHAYHVLDGHIFGFSIWEAAHSFSEEDETEMQELFEKVITPRGVPLPARARPPAHGRGPAPRRERVRVRPRPDPRRLEEDPRRLVSRVAAWRRRRRRCTG